MVLTFEFEDKGPGGKKFSCPIKCHRCTAKDTNGKECKRRVCIGLPYCWYHLQKKEKLKIKDSQWGKGLFAWDPENNPGKNAHINKNKVVFKNGDNIGKYDGEIISSAENTRRYGKKTGPYSLGHGTKGNKEDAACKRTFASLVNHQDNANQNAELISHRESDRHPWEAWIQAKKNIKNGQEIFISYTNKNLNKKHAYRFDENIRYTTKNKSKRKRK